MAVLVAITGGSGSGKSTLASALRDALAPGAAVLVREDWYYHDGARWPGFDPAVFDFDHIDARDHAGLAADLQALRRGEAVSAPDYDFVSHARRRGSAVRVEAAAVVIAEGSHLLSAPELAGLFDLTVYVDTPADVRFIRRLLRDRAERGRSVESVVTQYLRTVRPAHARFTQPARAVADLVIEDDTSAADAPDPAALTAMLEPLLRHPEIKGLRRMRAVSSTP